MEQKVHEGRNVKRFREMLGIKQEALAAELGEDWTQKKISILETKDSVDSAVLQRISAALNIPVDALKSFDEEKALNIISNSFDNGSALYGYQINEHCTFHPVEKIVQLHEEKIALYERMLRAKDELIEEMKKLMERK
jgi:transcriptional regulator with XRE-family HTH domain